MFIGSSSAPKKRNLFLNSLFFLQVKSHDEGSSLKGIEKLPVSGYKFFFLFAQHSFSIVNSIFFVYLMVKEWYD